MLAGKRGADSVARVNGRFQHEFDAADLKEANALLDERS
jgi:hypothetical protein